jgi:hypothetical protein
MSVILKGGLVESSGAEVGLYHLWYKPTTVISSITLTPANGSTFSQYSHFALYGMRG